ncbi:MAG: hypothetical protein GY940_24215 [bacterium]|nr:hypothetical protein [bacterium]
MARWLPNGNIEFIGRIDNQVKIRGFRVELGEIESRLLTHPEIDAAAVMVIGDALAAYIVSTREIEITELRDHITLQLPDYMVPQYFVPIDTIPVTPQGKLDRRALPAPHFKAGEDYTAPSGPEEETLAQIWSEVLDIDKNAIGTDTNFFDLGGHSLRATIVLSRVHKAMDINVPLGEMFKTPTIKGLANYIKKAGKESFISIKTAEKKEYFPLSPAQKRIYMLQRMETDSKAYNMPHVVILEGNTHKDKLQEVFSQLVRRHESYRTSFIMVDGIDVFEKVYDPEEVNFELEYHDLTPKSSPNSPAPDSDRTDARVETIIQRFIRPFNLDQAPLTRVGLVKLGQARHLLMLDTHHIIFDGTSLAIFNSEFISLHEGRQLPPLRIHYKDYSIWRNSEAGLVSQKEQEIFWLSQWEDRVPVVELPLDFPRPEVQSFKGSIMTFEIDPGNSRRLKEIANQEGTSLFVLLLALLNILVHKMSGLQDIPIGTQIAGRRHPDLENIIGLFLNTLVLKNRIDPEEPFTQYLKRITHTTLEAFENQEYQFEDLAEKVLGKRQLNRNPLFDVMFIWQNMEMEKTQISGLTLKPYEKELKSSSLIDLSLYGFDSDDSIPFYFEYNTTLFKEETLQRFVTYFKEIISAAAADKTTKIKDIRIAHDLGTVNTNIFEDTDDDFEF